ncbi:MBL fold metallo-hydrolase [Streptomyces sp. SID3343]|uniref:MBL fold metallo-hydrolase n=1 Tax=Streptomyces sp. SID3343 TaxID=2690260 RepID=UPI0013702123|nr:MBL fold metallo-hydrolase [Streptomyces sp. SID3343]MYW04876.1 MBL fold metallo-hydrolase [Streptomyces sp. SID3343]
MSTRLVLLGTAGGPMPSVQRAGIAQALVVDDAVYLIDAGNGVARRMRQAGLSFGDLKAVFLTHHHSDHTADLGTLFLLGWGGLSAPVDVIGPPPLGSLIDHWFSAYDYDIRSRHEIDGRPALRPFVREREIVDAGVIYEDDRVRVTTALVQHPPVRPSFAFRFDTADGSVVISGDTARCAALSELARGADILVHEAIHAPSLAALSDVSGGTISTEELMSCHTSPDDAGAIAAEAGVRTLVLTHLVPPDHPGDEVWEAEARKEFGGRIVVGRDLAVLDLGPVAGSRP